MPYRSHGPGAPPTPSHALHPLGLRSSTCPPCLPVPLSRPRSPGPAPLLPMRTRGHRTPAAGLGSAETDPLTWPWAPARALRAPPEVPARGPAPPLAPDVARGTKARRGGAEPGRPWGRSRKPGRLGSLHPGRLQRAREARGGGGKGRRKQGTGVRDRAQPSLAGAARNQRPLQARLSPAPPSP
jgi:hypothetical protein